MAYSSVIVPRFGALRLDADPGDLGLAGAVDLRNVEFDPNGTVRTRPGFDRTDSNTMTTPNWLVRFRGDSQYALIGETPMLRAYNTSFASVDSGAGVGNVATHAVEFGDETASYLYVIASNNVLFRWDGADLDGDLTSSPYAKFVAVQPNDNRLVLAQTSDAGGATRNVSRVHFSEAGDPNTWSDDQSLYLHPNDGQEIRMLVAWGNNVFAFKETKFFVFYGNSVDSTGGPVFNYRTVDTGVGCAGDYAACAAQDGVYFVHQDGVYRTTGGTPELVSAAIQPFFDQRTNGFFTPTGPLTSPRIHAGDDRLYVWQRGATGMFVMDFKTRDWTYWVLNVAPYALLPLPDPRELIFADSSGRLHKLSPDYTDDDGTAISSYYQSGFVELAEGKETHVRDFDLWGTGTVTHQVGVDFGDPDTGSSVTLGTAPDAALGFDTLDRMGRNVSFKVGASSGAWSVSRWMARVKGVRDWT